MRLSKHTCHSVCEPDSNCKQLWQVRFTLPQARVLFRCPPAARQNARWSIWIPRGIQWLLRVQVGREVPPGAQLHLHAPLQLGFWSRLRSVGILYRKGTELPPTDCMVHHLGRSLRELVHHNQPLHSPRLNASVLHLHNRLLLVQVSPSAPRPLLSRMGSMVDADWCLHWMRMQCQVGWFLRHGLGRTLHG
jgi:hypothetical protein